MIESEELLLNIIIGNVENCAIIETGKDVERYVNRTHNGIIISESGEVDYYFDDKIFINDKKTVLFMPSEVKYHLKGTSYNKCVVINFVSDAKNRLPITLKLNDNNLYYEAENICRSFIAKLPGCQLKARKFLYKLIDNSISSIENKIPPFMRDAIRFINDNYQDSSLKNETIAAKAKVSIIYLEKGFNKYFHMPPKRYLNHIRMARAEILLTNSEYSIKEIAEKCGFSSQSDFCRSFKRRHHGNSPSTWKDDPINYL